MGVNSTIVAFSFSIRDEDLDVDDTVSAEIVRSTLCGDDIIDTGVIATVIGPSVAGDRNCFDTTVADYDVLAGDLLSVRITRTGETGALMGGAAAILVAIQVLQ